MALWKSLGRSLGIAAALVVGLGTAPLTAQPVQRVVILESMTLEMIQSGTRWLTRQLEDSGFRADENLELVVLNAEGDQAKGEDLLRQSIAESQPDLVISSATVASKAARSVLRQSAVPQLFFLVLDPVGAGLVPAVGAPAGGKITGQVHEVPASTKLDILARVLAGTGGRRQIRVALLHSTYPASILDRDRLLRATGDHAQIEFVPVQFDYLPGQEDGSKMIEAALGRLDDLRDRIDMIWLCNGPNALHPGYLTKLHERAPVPVIYGNSLQGVELGALFALVSDAETNGREAGLLAAAILGGADPGTISVERPKRFEVGFNLTTAQRLGAVIPSDLLALAGGNLFR